MGTSTNLLVNEISERLGAERFSFFEFAIFGVTFVAIGIVFMIIASRWLPKDKQSNMQDEYGLDDYVFTVKIGTESALIDKKLGELDLFSGAGVTVLKLVRGGDVMNAPGRYVSLKKGDQLALMGNIEQINEIAQEDDLIISDHKTKKLKKGGKSEEGEKEEDESIKSNLAYVEIMLLPGSQFLGKTLKQLRRFSFEGAFPIAIKKRKNVRNTRQRLIRKNISMITLKTGDRVLLELQQRDLASLHTIENIAILNEHEFAPQIATSKKVTCLTILLLVIGLAASGLLPILTASLCGVALMLVTKSISLEEIYHKVNWQIIFLLAGMIPLGLAMTNSGADVWISKNLLQLLTGQPAVIVLGLLFGFTMLMSGTISNNATAIIMTPIAIALAMGLSLEMKPFILAVMFGANFSFFTPVGYQTNTLIYGTGLYKFKHFLIIGGILSIILWIVGTLMLTTLL